MIREFAICEVFKSNFETMVYLAKMRNIPICKQMFISIEHKEEIMMKADGEAYTIRMEKV